jgi:heme A synthase
MKNCTKNCTKNCMKNRTSSLAWGTLLFLLAVILWGSFVRASGSGAGCGNHWPFCNGVVIPESGTWKTLVEFTHRVTSGISLILCAWICFFSFRDFPKGSLVRKGGLATLILILSEALVGAALVLLRLVESDQSALRAYSMSVHLMNTFLLLGAVTLTAHWAGQTSPRIDWRNARVNGSQRGLILGLVGLGFLMLLGASGAVTALGDTLFPSKSLSEGFSLDLNPVRHFLIQLRIYHPLVAVMVSLYLVVLARWIYRGYQDRFRMRQHVVMLLVLQCAQLCLGALNVLLLAPIPIQLAHLLVSDLIWIGWVLLVAEIAEGEITEREIVEAV